MKLHNYKHASRHDFVKDLIFAAGLDDKAAHKLYDSEFPRFSRYTILEEADPPRTSILWRITYPVLALYWLGLLLWMPFKYIATGSAYYEGDGFWMSVLTRWNSKL